MQPGSTGGRLIPPLGQLSLDDEMNDFVSVVARVFHVSGTRRDSLQAAARLHSNKSSVLELTVQVSSKRNTDVVGKCTLTHLDGNFSIIRAQ